MSKCLGLPLDFNLRTHTHLTIECACDPLLCLIVALREFTVNDFARLLHGLCRNRADPFVLLGSVFLPALFRRAHKMSNGAFIRAAPRFILAN